MKRQDQQDGEPRAPEDNEDLSGQVSGQFAIVGMSGRFPGASSVHDLWQLVLDGKNAFSLFSPEEVEDAFTDAERSQPNYVAARPHLADVDMFDAEFFGMFAREAAVTDPQHRIFLEICWEALEDGGYDPQRHPGLIGVFAGSSMPTYLINNVLHDRAKVEEFTSNYQIGCFHELVGALNDTLATRVAYKLNLRGPAFTLQSACSSSLLAVSQACQNLLTYSCDMALAGGISITIPQKRGYIYQEGGMASPDGTCRPFDASAAGTVFASGAGVVLLKRHEDALKDGDHIYAVIRGYGINNDGSDKVGFTAPSVEGQAEAIATALANAAVDPSTIGYIECHGTATPLGDPIEFNGLTRVFAQDTPKSASCALGSVKGTIGHTDAAAGVIGLIKTALALRSGKIPPMPNYRQPNPRIDLEKSPFYIPTAAIDWPQENRPRRAGVSAFGVGGTNIHVVLEEPLYPQVTPKEVEGHYILPLSARNKPALAEMRANMSSHLADNPKLSVAQLAHTLQTGRREFGHRLAIAAENVEEAILKLTTESYQPLIATDQPSVAFMFPGQGAQYVGMGAGLYRSEPEFAQWIDRGSELLKMTIGVDLRDYICHSGPATQAITDEQRETRIAQPCLYLVEYGLARLWLSRGVRPYAMIGHSVGEFVAATLANVISFEDGLRLVANRGRLMQHQPQGAMVSVRADAATTATYLRGEVEIAAINAPKLCVISGPFADIDTVCAALSEAEIAFSRLHTSHAFHSAMMNDAALALRQETEKVTYGTATIPFISGVTGDWQTAESATSPDYWAMHCRDAVRFADGLATLCRDRKPALLEVGPGRTLSVFAAQTIARDGLAAVVQTLPEHDRAAAAAATFAEAHGKLWMAGCRLDWPTLPSAARQRLSLPTYPFQRQRHWIDAPPSARRASNQRANAETDNPPQAEPLVSDVNLNGENRAMNVAAPISASRLPQLETALLTLLSDMSGETLGPDERAATFLELGFDSLFVGQFAQRIEKDFKVKISFRELLSDIPSVADLAVHLDRQMPPDAVKATEPLPAAPVAAASMPAMPLAAPMPTMVPAPQVASMPAAASDLATVLQSQIQMAQTLFSQQLLMLQAMQGGAQVPVAPSALPAAPVLPAPQAAASQPSSPPASAAPVESDFGTERIKLYRPNAKSVTSEISAAKQDYIAHLTGVYETRNAKSKTFTQDHRGHLADPRSASGFRADWKEMVFPIVCDHSKGAYIWDIDGNRYVDLVNGFGQTAFGHAPDFVIDAVKAQADRGFAIGPQTPLAGDVAKMIAEVTGHERVTFCNTGSEAVMAAMRLARAVTGRDRVVVFANDYHGQFDEVLVKGRNRADKPIALPVASGIPMASVSNMTVLRYGGPESLDFIRANAADIAAVIIEPIQSRHPELQPRDFVAELRDIATKSEFALVFDEVVTGFRVDPGGMQAIWGIKGDMATYGKVVGGGMPIGVLVGSPRFMDALDGGHWAYGDSSVPMTAPTFFAGTFVRHPLVLAAAQAVLHHIKGEGSALYGRVAERTEALVAEIRADLARRGIADVVHGYKSWFATDFSSQDPLGALFYAQMRLNGVHIQDGYPCFLTTAHSEDDFRFIEKAFRDSLDAMQAAGIFSAREEPSLSAMTAQASVAKPQSAPLTEAQMEIWLAAQAGDEASCSFNESFSLTLDGQLDEKAMRKAFDTVIARHDAFHIRFDRGGEHFQFIPDFKLDLPILEGVDEKGLADIIDDEAHTPFDLINGPLVRTSIVKLAPEKHVLVFTAHHIICDGWSINTFVEELATAYEAHKADNAPEFQPALSFATYSTDLSPRPEKSQATEQFWLDQFKTVPDLPDLPLDRPRPEYRSFAGGSCTGYIGADDYKALKKRGAKSGATLFSTLLATLQVMISRLSGQDDIVIAIPSAGQSLLDGQILVGHCVNLLPLRQAVSLTEPFAAHLKATQQLVFQAFEHQDYTYGTLVRKLDTKRDPRRLPLTEIQFNLERMAGGSSFGDLTSSMAPNAKAFSNFDLFFNMIEMTDRIRIDVDYNADIFERATVERWIGHFSTLAATLAKGMDRKVSELSLLSAEEKSWLIDDLNQTATPYDHHQFVFSLFSKRAAQHPNAIAAQHDGQSITYGDLETHSNQLALYLQMTLPEPGQRIAILVERSLAMIIALLAVMKAGHAYVPMDPAHPEPRLLQTLDIARIGGMICDSDAMARLATTDIPVIRLDHDAKAISSMTGQPLKTLPVDTTTSAYIIFTSGSTGMPKGVEVSHQALTNFLLSMTKEPGFSPDDTLVAVTTISFDIAGLELYLPLISGGKVVIASRSEVQDGFALVKLVCDHDATVLQATPTLWQMLVEAGLKERRSLKMLCGGEPLPRELARSLLGIGGELWNMYGPTETTIWSSLQRIMDADQPITIGHPIANTQLFILDHGENVAPIGVIGELHIGGDGLAEGYFDRLDLTEKAFVPHCFAIGRPMRLYRTGDVGRRLADGSLQLLGRRDQQIKLRGFRIELGDIEAVVSKAGGVLQCAVVVAENAKGDRALVCYVVPSASGKDGSMAEVVAHAKASLPAHMVPSFWVMESELPRTANGKLDRKTLQHRGVPQRDAAPIKAQPKTEMEQRLLTIWQDVLNLSNIGIDDNLYALGADSLVIFRIAARMRDNGLPLEAKHLLRHPTIATLAAFVDSQGEELSDPVRLHIPSLRDFRNGARRGLGATL